MQMKVLWRGPGNIGPLDIGPFILNSILVTRGKGTFTPSDNEMIPNSLYQQDLPNIDITDSAAWKTLFIIEGKLFLHAQTFRVAPVWP